MVNEFPMMAGLVARNAHVIFCGATIIDKSYAVTAAHCTKKRDVRDVALLVGDHDYRTGSHSPLLLSRIFSNFFVSGDETKFAAAYRLSRAVIHPGYTTEGEKHDIALIQTTHPMTFNEAVGPVCLPYR